MDSFKGSLPAAKACSIVAEAVRETVTSAEVVAIPMADGGEGTAAALMAACNGQWVPARVMGPLPEMQVEAGFLWLPETRVAVVEMARASGLELLDARRQNPLETTTYGTGQLIDAAVRHGAERILLAVGGSATVDGGVGAAVAVGWRFLTRENREVPLGGGGLSLIDAIVPPARDLGIPLDVLCDVDNPLCGPQGAAWIYGPQKGATPQMVRTLDAGLAHLADLAQEQIGARLRELPGGGAAGGLAAGAVAFMGARLVSGIDVVMAQSGLTEAVAQADWVLTGEGRFDHQSLRGKVVSGVSRLARAAGARVGVIAGQVLLPAEVYRQSGIEAAEACMNKGMPLDEALTRSRELLAQATQRFALTHLSESGS